MGLKRETWKRRRVFVVRGERGKIITWSYAKGNYKTKADALKKFKTAGSLNINILKRERITAPDNPKPVYLSISKKRVHSRSATQVKVEFGVSINGNPEPKILIGYSKKLSKFKGGGVKQAQKMAYAEGIRLGVYDYEDEVSLDPQRITYLAYT